jgi:AmmeMemoRadiSam system protein A
MRDAMSDRELGQALIRVARGAIGAELGFAAGDDVVHEGLTRPGATFVTLMKEGELRGCIGTLSPVRTLRADVAANAVAAAFRDPRFPPLAAFEFTATTVEVSMLSASEPIAFADEAHLLAQLRPGVDGVILEHGRHRATFLPQVWETLDQPREFFEALKHKAGLPAGFWHPRLNVSRYSVIKWKQTEFPSLATAAMQ